VSPATPPSVGPSRAAAPVHQPEISPNPTDGGAASSVRRVCGRSRTTRTRQHATCHAQGYRQHPTIRAAVNATTGAQPHAAPQNASRTRTQQARLPRPRRHAGSDP
jgi:hypothetical protein